MSISYDTFWKKGHLHAIDDVPTGDPQLGSALKTYSDLVTRNRTSLQWLRAIKYIENILFSQGHHYINNILTNRLASDTSGNLSVVNDAVSNLPKPTNDLLSRYIETNIALLTENRPRPRVTPKSDRDEDITAAELSELTLEYLWEAMHMPEKMREIARLIMHCGVCWMEISYDPVKPRRLTVPETTTETQVAVEYTPDGTPIPQNVEREVTVTDDQGRPQFKQELEFGDLTSSIVSPFEMHVPSTHWWHDQDFGMGWVMREMYVPIDSLRDKYLFAPRNKAGLTKKNGWNLDALKKVKGEQPYSLPLWWWQRVAELVEGPGPNIYIGTSDDWEAYTIVRILDRKPNNKWPKGRTIITVGDEVLYDSPKDIGARAYDPRWPDRWHPYIRFRWEAQPGSIYGRSLLSKLIPKLKRINAIDTTMIMWRRTVPIATWVAPKGSHVVEDLWFGQAGMVWQYDPRRTDRNKPEPVYPPPYPQAALEERAQQLAEMESIAGTEEILRGQRPTGVNCWVEGSKFTDAYGRTVDVSEIEVGDRHMSMKGAGSIGAVHARPYEGEVYTIQSYGNLPITVTPSHKLPVIDASVVKNPSGRRKTIGSGAKRDLVKALDADITFKEVQHIDPQDLVVAGFSRARDGMDKIDVQALIGNRDFQARSHVNPYIALNEDVLWLLGMYLAEGQIARRSNSVPAEVRWTLSFEEEDTLGTKLQSILSDEFGVTSKIRYRKDTNAIDVCVSNVKFAALMDEMFGSGSRSKRIHPGVFNTPYSLLPLVAGWLDGDGNKHHNSLRGDTVSDDLAAQMRAILLDERIAASLKFSSKKQQYTLTVCGQDATELSKYAVRWNSEEFRESGQGRKGHWTESYWVSNIQSITTSNYSGNVYNVTMNELSGECDNTVNSFGMYSSNSAAMIDILRKQALMSRSPILQAWDESLQTLGSHMLIEVIRHIGKDSRYAERIRVLAREKASRLSIETFSGADLSDNVMVRVDTASMALVSKEAREAKVLEFLQYAPALMSIPDIGLRQAIVEELGFKKALTPQGPHVDRAKKMISLIKQNRFDRIVPMVEDDPYVMHELLVREKQSEAFWDMSLEQQQTLLKLIDMYRRVIEFREQQMLKLQLQMGAISGQQPQQGAPV